MPHDTLFWFKTQVGTFWIAPQPDEPGRVVLGVDEKALGSYVNPVQAADDVRVHVTGHHAWDRRKHSLDDARKLSDWKRRWRQRLAGEQ